MMEMPTGLFRRRRPRARIDGGRFVLESHELPSAPLVVLDLTIGHPVASAVLAEREDAVELLDFRVMSAVAEGAPVLLLWKGIEVFMSHSRAERLVGQMPSSSFLFSEAIRRAGAIITHEGEGRSTFALAV
jgi:hypothetical protein